MTYIQLMQQLKKKQIPAVSLLYGKESYFIQNLKEQFVKAIRIDTEDIAVYDLEETSIQEVIADAETYPFFGEQKLIIASNPVFLKAKPDKLSFEHQLEVLEKYVASPVDYSILVFIAPYEKLDERKKVTKLLKKNAVVAECNPIKPYELTKWIKDIAEELQISIANDAFDLFEAELSTNLHLLENELIKIASYVGAGGHVTKEIAEELIAHTTDSSSLRLVDAVMEGDLHKAVSIYKALEKMKEEPIALIALLAFQFRTILRVKLLKQKGYSQSIMQKQIGAHPYVIKVALNREKQFSTLKLQTIIHKLAEADAMMKQGKMEKDIAFELLLYELIQSK